MRGCGGCKTGQQLFKRDLPLLFRVPWVFVMFICRLLTVNACNCDMIIYATDSPRNQAKTVLKRDEYEHSYKLSRVEPFTACLRILKPDFIFRLPGLSLKDGLPRPFLTRKETFELKNLMPHCKQ